MTTLDLGETAAATLRATAEAHRLLLIDPTGSGKGHSPRDLWVAIRNTGHDAPATAVLHAALAGMLPRVTPERIPEPGTWGVVSASCVHDDERREWVHHPDGNWWPAPAYSSLIPLKGRDRYLPDDWDSLEDPMLVREGVAS